MNDDQETHAFDLEISAEDLSLVYDNRYDAVRDVNLDVKRGEFVSIVGPSGCGKSTLLRLIAGLEQPTSGNLSIGSTAQMDEDASESKQRAGFVFQQATLLPWRTAAANVGLPLELDRSAPSVIQAAVEQARKLVGLTAADMHKLPRMLSGGMRMRVSIARAMVAQPQMMLLDEPFGALDDLLRGQLNEEFVRLWLDRNWTTLFVTHNVGEAVLLAERVLVMSPAPGRIADQIEVPLPYPRLTSMRSLPEFAALVGKVGQAMRDAAKGALTG